MQKREKEKQNDNINNQITQMLLASIMDALGGADTDYNDKTIMRLLIESIKVIGKHELEFRFKCGINITETI